MELVLALLLFVGLIAAWLLLPGTAVVAEETSPAASRVTA